MMREKEVLVSFRPSGKEAYVLPGTRLVEAAAEAGLALEVPCGGEGLCGRCRVKVSVGAAEPTATERQWLSGEQLAAGWRLACQTSVCGPTEVDVPPGSRPTEHKILVSQTAQGEMPAGLPDALLSPVRKQYVELPPPARGDDLPDMLRLERVTGAGPLQTDLELLRELPARLRQAEFRGTAVLAGDRLLDFEPGNTTADAFAVAVDMGTTTLVAALYDLGTGNEWAVESRLNPQTQFGDDVLSRILYARQYPDGLGRLQSVAVQAVNEMIGRLCKSAGIARRRIYAVAFAGNTTMQQLLCGIDTAPLGEVPFAPAGGRAMDVPSTAIGLQIHPRGDAYIMPLIGGFVGGDTVAGMLATEIDQIEGPALLVDIGTNGEIVLSTGGKLFAASTAAGPAFEGARIACGMRGCTGAIEKVVFDGRLRLNVIGDVAPMGLCGSGLIDLAAELLRNGVLTSEGRLVRAHERTGDIPPDLAARLTTHDGQPAFILASAEETGSGGPILVTQRDLRELQLAAGAIRAGVAILLRRAGFRPDELQCVMLGGGFGNFIRRSNAQRIGLLPGDIPRHRIRYMGNTSLAGARLAALSISARQKAEQLARRTEHVDLSTDPNFQHEFAEAMLFPES